MQVINPRRACAARVTVVTPRLRRGRVIGPVCVCVSVCLSVPKILKTLAKEPFRQKDGLRADIYATCTITLMFMYVVVLETAVSAIHSASCNTPYSFVFVRMCLLSPCTTPYSSV